MGCHATPLPFALTPKAAGSQTSPTRMFPPKAAAGEMKLCATKARATLACSVDECDTPVSVLVQAACPPHLMQAVPD